MFSQPVRADQFKPLPYHGMMGVGNPLDDPLLENLAKHIKHMQCENS
jgi:hypothetical protein